jgi:hypothetical protein
VTASAQGVLRAIVGIERAHATEREYPFHMVSGDSLRLDDGRVITFDHDHTFNSREEQDQYVQEH